MVKKIFKSLFWLVVFSVLVSYITLFLLVKNGKEILLKYFWALPVELILITLGTCLIILVFWVLVLGFMELGPFVKEHLAEAEKLEESLEEG